MEKSRVVDYPVCCSICFEYRAEPNPARTPGARICNKCRETGIHCLMCGNEDFEKTIYWTRATSVASYAKGPYCLDCLTNYKKDVIMVLKSK